MRSSDTLIAVPLVLTPLVSDSAELIPMKPGMFWEYEVEGQRYTQTDMITDRRRVLGFEWYGFSEADSDVSWIRNGPQGVIDASKLFGYQPSDVDAGRSELRDLDEQLRFRHPAEEGESYAFHETTVRVHGQTSVAVPAGRFECMVYDFFFEQGDRTKIYLAPGVGVVRKEETYGHKHRVLELVRTGVRKLTPAEVIDSLLYDNWRVQLQRYVDEGSDVNAHDGDGYTLLHRAAQTRNVDAIRWIVAQGGEINVTDSLGNTPLHDTIEADIEDVYAYGDRPKFRVAKLLHDLGADVTVRNVRGQTPLDVVGNYGQDAEYFRNVLAEVLDLR